jgi:signal transduction histidine kinase/PAS domain-containing protein
MPHRFSDPSSLAESERRLRFLDGLSQTTRALTEPAQVMQATARLLGEHLGASRCAYAWVEDDQDHFELIGDYNDGVDSIVGRYAFSDFGAEVLRLMRADEPYVNHDVDVDPRTAPGDLSAYRLTRIQAVICVPLHKHGVFVAAMAVHQNTPRRWTDGEIALVREVVSRCWDALDRIRNEQALREANEQLSLALAAGHLGDWSWDAASDVVTLSERGCEIFGLPRGAQVTWAGMRERLHPDDREAARVAVLEAAAARTVYGIQYRVLVPGQPVRWVSAQGRATYRPDGSLHRMIGIVQDVTAWREAEEAARVEARMLELLNRTGAALAAQLDLQALLQEATDAATRLTGARFGAFFYNGVDAQGEALLLYTLSGAPRSAFEHFGHPRPTALFGPTFRGEPPLRIDDVLADPRYGQWSPHHGMPPGHLPVRSYLAVPVLGRDQRVIGGLFFGHPDPGVFTERSERLALGVAAQAAIAVDNAMLYAQSQRAAEERRMLLDSERAARQEAERANALKDEFLATLSHELRTPLAAILGWAHILRRKLAPELAELHKGVEVIERSARAQAQLIDDLLDMSRVTSGKLRLELEPVAPIAFVEPAIEALRPAADAGGVRIQAMLDAAAGPVTGDAARLQQVVWNLVANAIKFTPRGGTVQVLLRRAEAHAEITVRDTGIGIEPAFLPHIFDRFRQADGSTTRRYGGLGLGLSIVRHLVELHGGRVRAHSAGEGTGATFVVELPLAEAAERGAAARAQPGEHGQAELAPAAPPGAVDLGGVRVLVVDDEPDTRDLFRRVLEDCGAEVLTAGNARDAVEAVRAHRPRVLLSDIGMPDVDGYELLRRVRALGADAGGELPAIALTAFARAEDRARALRAGFSEHVSKPVEPALLIATVAAIAGRDADG